MLFSILELYSITYKKWAGKFLFHNHKLTNLRNANKNTDKRKTETKKWCNHSPCYDVCKRNLINILYWKDQTLYATETNVINH